MNYLNFPPGRQRRIAYSKNLARRNTSGFSNSSTFNHILSEQYMNNYEQMLFEPVKVGLISKILLDTTCVLNSEKLSFCVICQDDININTILRSLSCKHLFHINCIDKWLTENKKCPICKCEI